MSGIVGLVRRDGSTATESTLHEMTEAIDHRGPDGRDILVDGAAGLGGCLLATTPEDRHEQLPRDDGDILVTADARIDNRDELISRLADRVGGSPVTDSELIAAAYREWGRDCPEQLVGAYAFAVWDVDNKRLFCARDHIGIRPFYYYCSEDVVAFASEIKALLVPDAVPEELDERRLGEHLRSLFPDTERTFYSAISRLSPAHWMTVGIEQTRRGRYWSVDPSRRIELPSDEAYEDAFREIFAEAVRCRLRSIDDVGSKLSGGIDSSSVTCMARHLMDDDLATYSVCFEGVPAANEREYAEAVVDQGGVDPTFIDGTAVSPMVDFEEVLRVQDQPTLTPNYFLDWEVAQEAKRRGNRVVLTGFDGDRTLSHSNRYLADLLCDLRPLTFLKELQGLVDKSNHDRKSAVWHEVLVPLTPKPIKRVYKSVRGAESNGTHPVIDETFESRVGLDDYTPWEPNGEAESHAHQYHLRQLTAPILTATLEFIDHTVAAHGIEQRHPFCDRRLMEFCLAVPTDQKSNEGLSRSLIRRALEDLLPESIRYRATKADLGSNFDRSFERFERRRIASVPDNLDSIVPYVDTSPLKQASDCLLGSEDDCHELHETNIDPYLVLYKTIVTEEWLSQQRTDSDTENQHKITTKK